MPSFDIKSELNAHEVTNGTVTRMQPKCVLSNITQPYSVTSGRDRYAYVADIVLKYPQGLRGLGYDQ